MKRSIIALIMALAMILTLVACGNSNGDNNNGGNDVKAIQLSLGHTNNTDHQELLCRGWFLPPNTYDCGSFVVNGTAVVGKEPKKAL